VSGPVHVVLVEDDDIDVRNVRRAFAKAHITHPLYLASDGVEALELLRSGTVPQARRLVLLDINMPRMNGLEFLRELREDPALRHTTVVVLTTSDEPQDKLGAFALNVAGYLIKPVTFAAFLELMVALDQYWGLGELP
jgi:CheY-like chemotaxis protein